MQKKRRRPVVGLRNVKGGMFTSCPGRHLVTVWSMQEIREQISFSDRGLTSGLHLPAKIYTGKSGKKFRIMHQNGLFSDKSLPGALYPGAGNTSGLARRGVDGEEVARR